MSTESGATGTQPAAASFLVAVSVAFAGGVAGALFVGLQPGVNWILIAATVALPVALAFRHDVSAHLVMFSGLSLALVLTSVHSSAEWLLLSCLLVALGLASAAVAPGSTWFETALGVTAVAWRAPCACAWLLRSRPGAAGRRRATVAPLVRGLVLGSLLLAVFGALFASADRAFAQLADRVLLVPDVDTSLLPARAAVAGLAGLFAGALASFAPRLEVGNGAPVVWAAERTVGLGERRRRRLGRTEWITALAMLDALFAAFVAVQVAVLFGGRDHVLTTSGLTYAEYARSGFWQLAVVAALTLAVLGLLARYARRDDGRDLVVLKVLGGVLIALTLVVLASAFKRLSLYEEVYGFTRLRLVVHVALLWFAGIFAMVAVAGARGSAGWMPRAVVAFSALTLVIFTLARPDALIAERNVERFEATGNIDVSYLSSLSPDAVPALSSLSEPHRSCTLAGFRSELAPGEPVLSFNAARDAAREVLHNTPVSATALETCPYR